MTDVRNLMAQGAQVPLIPAPGEDPLEAQLAEIRAGDPPGFFLQAAPTYAGGTLPDGVWQRVPIGGTGQVLTVQADGSINWQNSSTGFANPMTTAGDTLYEAAGPVVARLPIGTVGQVLTVSAGLLPSWAVPVTGFQNPMTTLGDLITATGGGGALRLGIGTAGQVLTVSGGVPVWQNSAAGFTNPMTTAGDIIFENATPAPARLAIGTNGQVLTISGGLPTWQNSAAGFVNPMTTLGDIITAAGGGAAQRLAVGSAGQVLGISAGVPAWINSPAGFANPMTALGDLITGGSGGSAQRLAAGTNGQALVISPSGVPAWTGLPFITVAASGDTTGVQDISNINAAAAALPNGGRIWLLPQTYYIGSAGVSIPPYVVLHGSGHNTVINCVGGGTGTYILQYNTADPATYMRISGGIYDLVVDGTSAGNGAIGVNIQDMNGCEYRMGIRNFSGTGSTGLQIANNTHSTNNLKGHVRTENCTNHVVFTTLGAQNAIEHIYITFNMNVSNGQNAITLANSVGVQGSDIVGDAGVAANAGPVFTFGASTVFSDCRFLFKAEGGGGTGTTVSFNGAGSGFVRCVGILWFSPSMGNSNQVAQLGQVSFHGSIPNDSTLYTEASPPPNLGTYDQAIIIQPAFPGASGTAVTNNTLIPAWVTVAGGTLSAATQVNGVNIGDTNTRVFMVPRGQAIKLTWSAAPSGWVWQPVG